MIYLGIGSNLASKKGGKLVNIKKTIKLLNFYSVKVTKVSSFYETPSYPNKKYPKFINVIVSSNYKGSPEALLKILLYIEKKMGRIRIHKNEPRMENSRMEVRPLSWSTIVQQTAAFQFFHINIFDSCRTTKYTTYRET